MDFVDKSFNEQEAYIEEVKNKTKQKKYIKLTPVGYCQNCFEDLDDKKLFCNDKCATMFDLASKLNFT